jgi:hypothetical protein
MKIRINGKVCSTPEEIQDATGGNYNEDVTIKGNIVSIDGAIINIILKKKDSK